MTRRIVLLACLLEPPASAWAESGMLNLHGELGLAMPAAGYVADAYSEEQGSLGWDGNLSADLQPDGWPVAPQLRLFWSGFPAVEGVGEYGYKDRGVTVGVRWRFLDGEDAYQDLHGNAWVDADLGLHDFFNLTNLGFDLGVGYESSLFRPVSVGPYLRLFHVIEGAWDDPDDPAFADGQDPDEAASSTYVVLGLSGSVELLGEPAPPEVPPPPPGPADADGDGILDDDDRCPREAEDLDRFADDDGCPDLDDDGDEVPDVRDGAPNDPEDVDAYQDADGVPDPDNDGDEVPDTDDRAPLAPEDRDGFEDEDGVPDPDNDQDGVADSIDRCPTAPGAPGTDGCPRTVRIEGMQIVILERVEFRPNRDAVLPPSFPILEEIVAILRVNPGIRLRIEGHTDDRGPDARNLDLSARRARSVMRWFVEHGVDPERLEAQGFGETRPIDSNDTPAGRQKNRRVEFHIGDTLPTSN